MSDATETTRKNGRILIIGGTGLVGTPIVHAFDEGGWTVRVTSRNANKARSTLGPRVELMSGDANHVEDVERAMTGCQAVLICVSDLLDPYLDLRLTETVVRLAPRLGVERVGLISGASVAEERRFFPMINAKYQAEKLLEASGLQWVVLRLTWPMESLARFVMDNRASVLGHQPAVLHPVAGADIGRMVRRAFESDETPGHTFTIHGPEAFTMEHWLKRYCALTHPGLQVKHTPFLVVSAIATLTRNKSLKAAVELMRYFDDKPEYGDPTEANRLLGAPTITLDQWVRSQSTQPLAA